MGIESQTSAGPEPAPVFTQPDHELATYRAISPLAVASLVLGLLSIASFIDRNFLVAAVLAIVLGALSLRKIRANPRTMTGEHFGRAGLAMGLIFGLSSLTLGFVQDYLLQRRAEKFIREQLLTVLAQGDLNAALWYTIEPSGRKAVTPEEVGNRLKEQQASEALTYQQRTGAVRRLQSHLKLEPDARLKFAGIERNTQIGLTPVVQALIRVEWPAESKAAPHEHAPGEAHDESAEAALHERFLKDRGDYMIAILKSQREGQRESWWVEEYVYPYKPDSYVEAMKPVDDGHGHGH